MTLSIKIVSGSLGLILAFSPAFAADLRHPHTQEKAITLQGQNQPLFTAKNPPAAPMRSTSASIFPLKVSSPTKTSPFSFLQVVCIRGKVSEKKIEGSGFVIAKGGYILASRHQVEDASALTAHFQDGSSYAAKLLSVSETLDLALLQIAFGKVAPLKFSQDRVPGIGTPVIALGCPMGLNHSASQGIISAPVRRLDGMRLLQTDVAINPGNSGGPLLNQAGEVTGVIVGVFENARGISFALPAQEARRFLGESFFKIGTLFAEQNRNEKAMTALLTSTSFWNESAMVHSNIGEVYRRMKKYKVSEKAFLNALSFDPQYVEAHYNLGILYGNHLNNQKKAASHYRKYLKLQPNASDAAEVASWLRIAEAKQ